MLNGMEKLVTPFWCSPRNSPKTASVRRIVGSVASSVSEQLFLVNNQLCMRSKVQATPNQQNIFYIKSSCIRAFPI